MEECGTENLPMALEEEVDEWTLEDGSGDERTTAATAGGAGADYERAYANG